MVVLLSDYKNNESTVALIHAAGIFHKIGMEVSWLHVSSDPPDKVCCWWDKRIIRCSRNYRCYALGSRSSIVIVAGHNNESLRIVDTVASKSPKVLWTVNKSDFEPKILYDSDYSLVITPCQTTANNLIEKSKSCAWTLVPSSIPCFMREGLIETGKVRVLVWIRHCCLGRQALSWPRIVLSAIRRSNRLSVVVAVSGSLPRYLRREWSRLSKLEPYRVAVVYGCNHDDFLDFVRRVDWLLLPWQKVLFGTEISVAFSAGVPVIVPKLPLFQIMVGEDNVGGLVIPCLDDEGTVDERIAIDMLVEASSNLNLLNRKQECANWNQSIVKSVCKGWKEIFSDI